MKTLPLNSRFRRRERILNQQAEGTSLLVDLDDGRYYSLNPVGGEIWNLCDGERTAGDISAILQETYPAAADAIEDDLLELLAEMHREKLVEKLE